MLKKILIIFLFTIPIFSQNKIEFERYTDANGVHLGPITKIYQDNKGFIWIAGWGGLYRYDGYNFISEHVYNNGFISSLYEDKSGNLWIGTFLGLVKLDSGTETETQYKLYPPGPGTELSNRVLSILEDKTGTLWLGTADGLFTFNNKTQEFMSIRQHSTKPEGLSNNVINDIYEDKKGQLWFATGNGLEKYNRDKNQFVHYFHNPQSENNYSNSGSNINWVTSILEDRDGFLWIGTNDGLIKFNPSLNTYIHFKHNSENKTTIASNYVLSLSFDKSGTLWICTDNGVDVYDNSRNTFTHHQHDKNDPASLSNNYALSILCERSGTIWIGTYYGINKLNRKKQPFTNILDEEIQAIIKSTDDILYCQTPKGLKEYNTKTKIFTDVYFSESLIAVDQDGNYWFNKYGEGLIKRDPTGGVSHFYFSSGKEFNLWTTCIYKTHNDIVYIGTASDGVFFIDPSTNYVSQITKLKLYINVIYQDKYGLIWVGTANAGLYCFNKKRELIDHYIFDSNDPESVSFITILDIYEDKKENLWFCAKSGLNRYDRSLKKFIHYPNKIGSFTSTAFNVLEDNQGRLWLSSQLGVSEYDPETNSFRNYDFTYGLPANGFSTIQGYKNKIGEMYFASNSGLYRFHPDSIEINQYIPPVILSSFKVFNEDVKLDSIISKKKNIRLNYSDNSFSFEFAALNFVSPGKNQYAYKLEGLEEEWIFSGDRRYVSYSNLDPGKYVFRVKASNNDGIWNEKGTSLAIIISPPWWKTWWAYLLYTVIIFIGLYGVRRFELNREGLKNKIKMDEAVLKEREETDKMKSRFFANISHEFRTPLTLILGPAEKIYSNISDDIKKDSNIIMRNSRRLLQLINQLLDLSKLEAGKLKLEATCSNIVSFVKGITLSFESLSESKDITLKLISEKEFIELYFDKEKMTKILTNILSNAFKFTPEDGNITVSVREIENNKVELIIKDTGIGIPYEELPKLFDRFYQVDSSHTREYEGTGIGLALTKELVELHHGSITVKSEQSKEENGTGWTEFTLQFLMGKDHLQEDEIITEENVFSEVSADSLVTENQNKIEEKKLIPVNGDNPISHFSKGEEEKTIILVVEDNYDMREYIKDSLNKKEYHVEEAINGEQGVRKAEKIIPDLIISDLMMPKMDGNQLVGILKNNEKTSHIPIILLTAKAGQENKLEGLETGADDYLTKPFDIKELQIRIKNLIRIRKKIQEKYNRISEHADQFEQKGDAKENAQKLRSIDEKFLLTIGDIIEKHISEEDFNIEEFCEEVGMSRNQVHRKLKALTGKSTSLYIRMVKLNKAKKLIIDKTSTISEIAYSLGFSSPAYFTKCFKEEFGYPPSVLNT